MIRAVTVFTGSSTPTHPGVVDAVAALGEHLARDGLALVYGGAHVGLMGVLADAALAAGGRVTGVMPQALTDREIAHARLTELEIVPDMHRRKTRMAELGDAFVALPGGAGTLEELFEAWTWQQLGLHRKPVALFDVDGFWDPLLSMLDTMVGHGFLARHRRESLIVSREPADLVARLHDWPSRHSR